MSAAAADHPLDEALMLDDKHTVELAPGIVAKFYSTYEPGVTPVPVGTSPVNGVRWRTIIDKAHLNDSEMLLFLIWLEEAHGAAIHARALLPLQMLAPSLPSRSTAGGVKQEATQPSLSEQYGVHANPAWAPGPPSARNPERPPQREPDSDANDPSPNPILVLDMAAQGGMNGASLSTLTFVMLTCRLPPSDKDLGYGTDPTMSKAYSKAKTGGHGTLLLDLLGKTSTTGAELHAHFLLASEILRGCGETTAAQRLSEMWAVVQRTLPPLEMQRKYLSEYIRKYAGRGIPVLIDKDVVMLVLALCYGANSLDATVEAQRRELAHQSSELAALRAQLGEITIALKKKDPKDTGNFCLYCHQAGHTIDTCTKKKAADERAKAAAAKV